MRRRRGRVILFRYFKLVLFSQLLIFTNRVASRKKDEMEGEGGGTGERDRGWFEAKAEDLCEPVSSSYSLRCTAKHFSAVRKF